LQQTWLAAIKSDPTSTLLSSDNKAVEYFTKRDLLGQRVQALDYVWQLPEIQKIFQKQQPDGSSKHSGKETVS
jgi:hypothetical protein